MTHFHYVYHPPGSRLPRSATFVMPLANSTDDDYLSRLVDMGDSPSASYGDWQYLNAQESQKLEAELSEPQSMGSITGSWLLLAADPTRVNWQRNKWWGPEDSHLH